VHQTETLPTATSVQATMSAPAIKSALRPMERFRLRDRLQDLWRAKVEHITSLAVDYHTADASEDAIEATVIGSRLAGARHELTEIEAAMRRMDEGCYGRCEICSQPLAFDALIQMPQRRDCAGCAAS
jgi:DnaK suppressor protein